VRFRPARLPGAEVGGVGKGIAGAGKSTLWHYCRLPVRRLFLERHNRAIDPYRRARIVNATVLTSMLRTK
jgi:hypothetical protein